MRMDHPTSPKLVSNLYYVINKVHNPGFVVKSHKHGYNEAIYIISGKISLSCGNTKYALKEGDCIFIKAETNHQFTGSEESALQFLNIAYYGNIPDEVTGKAFKVGDDAYETLLRLKDVSLPPMDDLKAEIGACILTEFIFRCEMQLRESHPEKISKAKPLHRKRYYSKFLNDALDIITKRYSEDLRIGQVSSELCTSTSNLRTLFRKETGQTFTQHLQNARIEAAKEMLYKETDNISSIALKVGYKSVPAFFKVFRKFTAMTPAEFLKSWDKPKI